MSYDLRIAVKIDGYDKKVQIAEPLYSNPTYNLGTMFRVCTGWDYRQGVYYKCADVIGNIEQGIRNLRTDAHNYKKYEPDNGWGSIQNAIETLESLRDCIYETAEDIPMDALYIAW